MTPNGATVPDSAAIGPGVLSSLVYMKEEAAFAEKKVEFWWPHSKSAPDMMIDAQFLASE